ncbi:MAG: peptidylprolyl isomerase [Candidatus Woesearchaeota archaeon]
MAVKNGDTIKVEYTGMLEDGTVFDASEKHGKPLEFKVGEGMVIPGFEKGVLGMKLKEEKEIKIPAADAYGEERPELRQKVPRDALPKTHEPEVGMMVALTAPNGQHFPAKIIEVTPTEVTLDINHPLAGKTLIFKVKVVEIAQ